MGSEESKKTSYVPEVLMAVILLTMIWAGAIPWEPIAIGMVVALAGARVLYIFRNKLPEEMFGETLEEGPGAGVASVQRLNGAQKSKWASLTNRKEN
jgi:hypothetical protein